MKASEVGKDSTFNIFRYKEAKFTGVPKIIISLNYFHPFLSPLYNQTGDEANDYKDCLYLEILTYFSYIERHVNLTLADVFRAGNWIKFSYTYTYFIITIYSFSDIAEKICEKINIISNSYKKNYLSELKMNEEFALLVHLNIQKVNSLTKIRYTLRTIVDQYIYNKYLFQKEKFLNGTISFTSNNTDLLNSFIIRGLIYGSFSIKNSEKIKKIFEVADEKSKEQQFNKALTIANIFGKTPSNYIGWLFERTHLKESKKAAFPKGLIYFNLQNI